MKKLYDMKNVNRDISDGDSILWRIDKISLHDNLIYEFVHIDYHYVYI